MFFVFFWLVAICILLLTIGQGAMISAKDGYLGDRWTALGSPGVMYFIAGTWIFGGQYAQSLACFDLARDKNLSNRIRMTALVMSVLFLTMLIGWLGGLTVVLISRNI